MVEERKQSYPHSASLRDVSVSSREERKEKKRREGKKHMRRKTARKRNTEQGCVPFRTELKTLLNSNPIPEFEQNECINKDVELK